MNIKRGLLPVIEGNQETGAAFAQACANAKLAEFQARAEECKRLDKGIIEKVRTVDQTMAASEWAWNDVLPDLAKQQVLRSRRGKYQTLADEAGLETFEAWWERICRENGFKVPLRTVQNYLKKYRDAGRKDSNPKTKAGRSLPRSHQKRIILAGILAHDLADAAREIKAFDLVNAVEAFDKGSPSREDLQTQLTALSDVEAANVSNRAAFLEPIKSERVAEIQSGNVAGLIELFENSLGPQIAASFKGLSAEMSAQQATKLAVYFLRRYAFQAKGDGEYAGEIFYRAPRTYFRREWSPKKKRLN